MLFFTRELYDGCQDGSGWTQTARSKIERNCKLYKKYFRLIRTFLPRSAIRFDEFSFHDAQIVERSWRNQKLSLILDTARAFHAFPNHYAHITFTGVRSCPSPLPQKGDWWIWDEFHLGSRAKFSLHIMFTKSESKSLPTKLGCDSRATKCENSLRQLPRSLSFLPFRFGPSGEDFPAPIVPKLCPYFVPARME